MIRYSLEIFNNIGTLLTKLPIVLIAASFSYGIVNATSGLRRRTEGKAVFNAFFCVCILALILIGFAYLSQYSGFKTVFNIPVSIIGIHLLLNLLFLIGIRLLISSMHQRMQTDRAQYGKRRRQILIYGAGRFGRATHDAIIKDSKSNIELLGFIDDNAEKIGTKIHGLDAYGIQHITTEFIKTHGLDEVYISIQNISSERLLDITKHFLSTSIHVKIVPLLEHWIDGDLKVGQIKDVNIEDLLGRGRINIVNPLLIDEYKDNVILVSGAAGSIGSEIARKLSHFNYKKLILVDIAESPLYELQQEFIQNEVERFEVIIADVRTVIRMDQLFSKYKPDIVFHAAAYKHVPLMENNPYEAVSVNVGGTINLANISVKHKVKKFVMISTDKAVNPTNVMGATKRIAELYMSCLHKTETTKFITTRFGNVLGSNGSVIPLFEKQIEHGGPVTVTDKDITRFFMTITEACELVLEAAAMGSGGEIYVFDMGKSVKIYDLALHMIMLSGLRYPKDIAIKIIGLRPGEKIDEELLAEGEIAKPTLHEKIMIAKSRPINSDVTNQILKLKEVNAHCKTLETVSIIKDIVPEYISNNSKFEVLDAKK
ncbi:polysaccharide biosynthesis protein [Formosa sp. 4Alg 33]|uniref:polysaccharide biosynthesis protein n=1 Tax=Formosa sp. 4Alg 33 TaxID=3382189 RepID=UPI003D9C26B7